MHDTIINKDKTFITNTFRPFSSVSTSSRTTILSYMKNNNNSNKSNHPISPHEPAFSNPLLEFATFNQMKKENAIRRIFKSSFGSKSKLASYLNKKTDIKNQPFIRMLFKTKYEEIKDEKRKKSLFRNASYSSFDNCFLKIVKCSPNNYNGGYNCNYNCNNSNSNGYVLLHKPKSKSLSRNTNDISDYNSTKTKSNISKTRKRIVLKDKSHDSNSLCSYFRESVSNNSQTKLIKSKNISLDSSTYSINNNGICSIGGYNERKCVPLRKIRKRNNNYDIYSHLQKHNNSSLVNYDISQEHIYK